MLPLVAMAAADNPWFSWTYVSENLETLTVALQQHVILTVITVAAASAIAIPLAILGHRRPWLAGPILSVSGILYTIPSLALFILLMPTVRDFFLLTLIPLTMYAILVLVRNAITGLRQVPADVLDAAGGMGYSRRALSWRIELPLALPSILTGLRIATVSTVALVTVGYVVGYGGFGNIILTGFNNNFYRAQIVTGTIGCVLLAFAFDLALIGLGRLIMPWSARRNG